MQHWTANILLWVDNKVGETAKLCIWEDDKFGETARLYMGR
jgi:hypothetical protein